MYFIVYLYSVVYYYSQSAYTQYNLGWSLLACILSAVVKGSQVGVHPLSRCNYTAKY